MKLNEEIDDLSLKNNRMKSIQSDFCELRLPRLVSDGMVLQRDARVNI